MKALIADDDLISRSILEAVLRQWGYDVTAVDDGQEAWRALTGADAPKLAILDWLMPGMEGVEICRRLRELGTPEPPYLILLTMRDSMDDIVAGLGAGADDYVTKPFDKRELRARVDVGRRVVELRLTLARRVEELQRAVEKVQRLRGLLPICSFCKKIRDDRGYWEQVEVYIRDHAGVEFTHGLCPECVARHYPQVVLMASQGSANRPGP